MLVLDAPSFQSCFPNTYIPRVSMHLHSCDSGMILTLIQQSLDTDALLFPRNANLLLPYCLSSCSRRYPILSLDTQLPNSALRLLNHTWYIDRLW